MSYTLTSVTIRTDNTPEGMKKIGELWDDVTGGKLPILFDSAHNFQTGISLSPGTAAMPAMKPAPTTSLSWV